jgi:hypothetical protein
MKVVVKGQEKTQAISCNCAKLPHRTSPADASPLILEPLLLSPSGHSKHADAILSRGSVVAEQQIACLG